MIKNLWLVLVFSIITSLSVFSSEPSLLYVQGEARVSDLPDVATIRISIKAEEKEYEATIRSLNNRVNKLRQALNKELADDQLKTGRLQVRQNKEYQNRTHVFVGYIATQDIHIEIPFQADRLNTILQMLSQSAAEAEFSLGFKLSDKKRHELEKQAMQQAVADAREKAELLSLASGVELGDVKEIQYGTSTQIGIGAPGFKTMSARSESQAPAFHVEPDEVVIHDRVTMIFIINR